MKFLLTLICLFGVFNLHAQEIDSVENRLPYKDELINYEKIVSFKGPKLKGFNAIIAWCATKYNDANSVIKLQDRETGTIVGNGAFEISTRGLFGQTRIVKYVLNINVKDSAFRVQIKNILVGYNGLSSTYPLENLVKSIKTQKKNDQKSSKEFLALMDTEVKGIITSLETSVTKTLANDF